MSTRGLLSNRGCVSTRGKPLTRSRTTNEQQTQARTPTETQNLKPNEKRTRKTTIKRINAQAQKNNQNQINTKSNPTIYRRFCVKTGLDCNIVCSVVVGGERKAPPGKAPPGWQPNFSLTCNLVDPLCERGTIAAREAKSVGLYLVLS